MTLEEEKKLVAEKLMGWDCRRLGFYRPKHFYMSWQMWNPQSERKWWDKIWDKISENDVLTNRYVANLQKSIAGYDNKFMELYLWVFHTAKPETCWKALVKTLTEMEGI